jgi:hypothetical protein
VVEDSPFATYSLLLSRLAALEALLASLRLEHPEDADFLASFNHLTEDIDNLAGVLDVLGECTHYWQFVHERYDEMFETVGLSCPPWHTPAT